MNTILDIFVPGHPATKGSAKGFGFRRGNGSIGVAITNDNPKAKAWAAVVTLAARDAMAGRAPTEAPVRVLVEFHLPRPKAHFRANGQLRPDAPRFAPKKPDGDKLERCAWDALTGVVFVDDAQIVSWSGAKPYAVEGRIGARVVVQEMSGGETARAA